MADGITDQGPGKWAAAYRDGDALLYTSPDRSAQVFVTALGALAIAVDGEVVINTVADWHRLGRRDVSTGTP